MIGSKTIQGITFFNSNFSCILHFEKAHFIKKALSCIQSFGRCFIYHLRKTAFFWDQAEVQMIPYIDSNKRTFSKQKLLVCLHGLNNSPMQFKNIVEEIEHQNPSSMDIYIPRIKQRGNAKLREMVDPIFEEIKKWAQKDGEKELVLVGISNGGRIARAIDARLAKSKSLGNINSLRFVSIVGACKGSSLAGLINKVGLSWLISRNIAEEMPINSRRNAQLNKDFREGLARSPKIKREYTFIASAHDWLVPNYSSTLMKIPNQQTHYAIIPGHGHGSIVKAATKAVVEIIL